MSGAQDQTKAALFARVASMVLDPPMPVSMWDQKFDRPQSSGPSGKPLPYLEAKVFTAPTVELHVNPDDEDSLTGFLQINLMWPQGSGEMPPTRVVSQIVSWFRRGKAFKSGSTVVEIQKQPSAATPFLEAPYTKTQITIPYQVYAKQF